MKHLVATLCVLLMWCSSFAQTLTRAEVFFTTDPGVGHGTAVTLTPSGSIASISGALPIGLSSGVYTLSLRTKSSAGFWSVPSQMLVSVVNSPYSLPSIQTITQCEYFMGNDPGAGLGVNVPFTATSTLASMARSIVTSQAPGFYPISVRFKTSAGFWGVPQTLFFEVRVADDAAMAQQIVRAEYFIGNDPGVGNGTTISLAAPADPTAIATSALTNQAPGIYAFSIRTKSDKNFWSIPQTQYFQVSANGDNLIATAINRAEYFINTDPGVGQATPIVVSIASDPLQLAFNALANQPTGVYNLCLRTRSDRKLWSVVDCKTYRVEEGPLGPQIQEVVAAEYFINTDPGVGSANAIDVNDAVSVNLEQMLDVSSLPTGTYTLGLRFKSNNGVWSQATYREFVVCVTAPAESYFTAFTNGFNLELSNLSQNSTSFEWTFGDGNTSTQTNPTHLFQNAGDYNVCLATYNQCSSNADTHCELIHLADTLRITSVAPGQVIPGEAFAVSFETNYITFSGDNEFKLWLSDPFGNFNNPILLGTLQGGASGTFQNVFIPYNTPADCYQLRVTSSAPALNSRNDELIMVEAIVNGNGNNALYFDGVNDYLDFGSIIPAGDFSVSFWVKPMNENAAGSTIADIQNDLVLYSNPLVQDNYVLSHLLQFDMLGHAWNHVTITMDAETSTRKVYLFGQLIEQNNWGYNRSPDYHFTIGKPSGFNGAYMKGMLDDVKIWNTTLTSSDVLDQLYNLPVLTDNDLVAFYDFNDRCSSLANDSSDNGNNAILHGNVQYTTSDVPVQHTNVHPDRAGNGGWITVHIEGAMYQPGSVVTLLHPTYPHIVASSATVTPNQQEITVRWNLLGSIPGLYDIEIVSPAGDTLLYTQSFTIEEAVEGDVEVQILGRNTIRAGGVHTFFVVYQNTSNNDLYAPYYALHAYNNDYIAYYREDLSYRFQVLPMILGDLQQDPVTGIIIPDSIISPGVQFTLPVYSVTGTIAGFSRTNCTELSQYVAEKQFPNRPNPNEPGSDGHNYIDGCSNPQEIVDAMNVVIPGGSNTDWNAFFSNACATHDLCYQTCYSQNIFTDAYNTLTFNTYSRPREICDFQLYNDMLLTCQQHPEIPEWECGIAAQMYYQGVRDFGWFPFTQDQTYCDGDADMPPPANTGPTYQAPDCNECPPGAICFSPRRIGSYDPNVKIGPTVYQNLENTLSYAIYFENDSAATAAAQLVTIIDTLDITKVDVHSVKLKGFGFGTTLHNISIPASSYSVDIDLRPASNYVVRCTGNVNELNGIVRWQFETLDPITMALTEEATAGFLPPNRLDGLGQGFVYFDVNPLEGLQTGDTIFNAGHIFFDYNPVVTTEEWMNIVDLVPPISSVVNLPAVVPTTTFNVQWTGEDPAVSEVAFYDVYSSTDGENFSLWLDNTTSTNAEFTGEWNQWYYFYTVAFDLAGNAELQQVAADDSTLVMQPTENPVFVIQTTPSTCAESFNGSAVVTVLGGVPPYFFMWDQGVANDSLVNALGGVHTLVVTDLMQNIVLDTTITIASPEPIFYSVTTSDATCFGANNGLVIMEVSGGTGILNVDFGGVNSQQLAAGDYPFVITDENGCSTQGTFSIGEPSELSATISSVNVSSTGICDGTVEVSPTGGTAPYTVEWISPSGVSGTSIINACEGAYEASITDANGCVYTTASVNITTVVNEAAQELISVWPNPNQGSFVLHMSNKTGDGGQWKVTDSAGRLVKKGQVIGSLSNQNVAIDLVGVSSGIYQLEFTTKTWNWNTAVVVKYE
jgi:hypothetical protein